MARPATTWRDEVRSWATQAAASLDDFVDIRWRHLKRRFDWDGIPQIQPYIGYANDHDVWLHGRVLTNPPAELPGEDDQWWENIANTFQRFASDEVPHCDVLVRLGDAEHRVTTDAEGYFFVNQQHRFPNPTRGLWSTATMQIVDQPRVAAVDSTVTCKVMTPPSRAQFGVISDVDDTILHTGATHLLTMAKMTFLGNARTRLPLEGAATLYQALQGTGTRDAHDLNPIFYVSSSPWNLFDLLEDFLQLHNIPLGPLLLRDLGFDENKFLKGGHDHKLDKIRRLLAVYPELPFVLVGDSGQEDARLYATAAEEFGERIKVIFIRDVDPDETTRRDETVAAAIAQAERNRVPMHLVRDSIAAGQISASLGLIPDSAMESVRKATARDYERETL